MVEKIPKTSPEAQKAAGIDKIPVPNEAFNKCVNVSQSLKKIYIIDYKN